MKKTSITTFSVKTSAKLVQFDGGEKKFMAWLRQKNYLQCNNEPYQKYIDLEWFVLVKRTIHKASPPFTVTAARLTIRGLERIAKIIKLEKQKNSPCP